ncbi:30S ribosomal protein S18 [Patescibacteria group bacterium]|nr:30S ribosomal protein S18 [Patescibacteria group bacterium]
MDKKRKSSKPRVKPVATNCPFCKAGSNPNYKDVDTIEKFITDRAKIIGKSRSGLCAKHQRQLSRAVKQARHIGLLPFTGGL